MLLSGHWTFADTTILQNHSPKPKHFDMRASERPPISSELPLKDEITQANVLSDLVIEFTNISVTREEMIKG